MSPEVADFLSVCGQMSPPRHREQGKDHMTPNHQPGICAQITCGFGISASDGLGAMWRDTAPRGADFSDLGATTQGVRQRGNGEVRSGGEGIRSMGETLFRRRADIGGTG